MKKEIKDLKVAANERFSESLFCLKLTCEEPLPEMRPGQFVEVRVDGSGKVFLRRPISIHFVDRQRNELWLLIQMVGEGTRQLSQLQPGDLVNVLLPLGNGFSPVGKEGERVLLVGGGVGIAPLLEYGKYLKENGAQPVFLLGAKSENGFVELPLFEQYGPVYLTTEDGSRGERGFVTQHSILSRERFDRISVCGPGPMMKAVGRFALKGNIPCEVSLENRMACGLGACLCCVEQTVRGNVCVCQEGPVFDIRELRVDS